MNPDIKFEILRNQTPTQKTLDFMPSAVFFDLNSTVLDTMEADLEALFWAMENGEYNKESPPQISAYKKDYQTLWNSLRGMDKFNLTQRQMHYIETGRVKPFPNLFKVLVRLKQMNISIGIITNRTEMIQRSIVKKYPLLYTFFDVWQFPIIKGKSDPAIKGPEERLQNKYEKPNPIMLDLAINQLDPRPDIDKRILFIGDAESDIEFAENCKITPILFYSEQSTVSPEFITARPNLKIIANHTELEKMISGAYRKKHGNIKTVFSNAKTKLHPLYVSDYGQLNGRYLVTKLWRNGGNKK